MLIVHVLASSPVMREELRRLVESPEVRVEDAEDAESGLGRADDEVGDVASDVGRLSRADVLLFGDQRALERWHPEAGEGQQPAVVVLAHETGDAIRRLRALDLHGWAVLPRGVDADALHAAIMAAASGLAVIPVETLPAARPSLTADDLEPLTPREQEVLNLLADGLSNKQIAERLDISGHTAKFHVASVLAKLGAANRADAVRRGVRRGLVSV
jgi:DNA-binding NarL/FixJ family response regulator